MSFAEKIETDLVIVGGGIMGTAVAYQAATLGIRSVILENQNLSGPHYASSFWAPRADYLPKDIDEVERTDSECGIWQNIFPDIFKPRLFLLLMSDLTPHSFYSFKSLMELYDRLASIRSTLLPAPHFYVDGSSLMKMEPNLKMECFSRAIGFYEFVADPNMVRDALWNRTLSLTDKACKLMVNEVRFGIKNGHINEAVIMTKSGKSVHISNEENRLVVINAAGPWINEVASLAGVSLPVTLYGGVQLAFPRKYCFSSILISFAKDGKYLTVVPQDDYIQVGPSNIRLDGKFPDFLKDEKRLKEHVSWINDAFSDIVEPGVINKKPAIKAVGARVKLNSVFDSNRPFIIPADEYGLDNFFSVYPGKLPSALRAADELLKFLSEKGAISGKRKFFLGPKSRVGIIVSSDRLNIISAACSRFKSLCIVGHKVVSNRLRRIKKPQA